MKQFRYSFENDQLEYIYDHRFICEIQSDEDNTTNNNNPEVIDLNEDTETSTISQYNNKSKGNHVCNEDNACIRVKIPFQSKRKRKKLKKHIDNKELLLSSTAQCSICLNTISTLASPNTCNHDFCKECLIKWTTECTNQCPLCKKEFFSVISYEHNKRNVIHVKRKRIEVKDYAMPEDKCYVCNSAKNKEEMLVCSECCVNVCHLLCDGLVQKPKNVNEWMCLFCRMVVKEEKKITKRIGKTFIY